MSAATAEPLRMAAAKLRELAQASVDASGYRDSSDWYAEKDLARALDYAAGHPEIATADARLISAISPTVALAVADLLDAQACIEARGDRSPLITFRQASTLAEVVTGAGS